MKIKIYYYGIFSKITGKSSEEIDFNGKSIGELKKFLRNMYPEIFDANAIISINFHNTTDGSELKENDEIIIMSPSPGG